MSEVKLKSIKIDKEVYKKLEKIAKQERRTLKTQLEIIINQFKLKK